MFTWNYINCVENRFDLRFRPGGLSHRIEINQKSNSCENLSPFFQCTCPKYAINMPFWRHIDTILASSPCTFDLAGYDICRLRRLTFCWRFVLIRSYIRKKLAVRTAGGTCQDGILMATMRCARTQTSKVPTQSDFWFISILWLRPKADQTCMEQPTGKNNTKPNLDSCKHQLAACSSLSYCSYL